MGITGIILAGGKSKRMGVDKGRCLLGGKALVSFAIDVLENICEPLLIIANNSHYDDLGFQVVPDYVKGVGPIGGILTGLKNSPTEDTIILSCDMPLISKDLIHYILDSRAGQQAIVPVFDKLPEPLCAYYSKNAMEHVQKCVSQNIYKVQDILNGLDTLYLPIDRSLSFYQPDLFANVNDEKELCRIENIVSKPSGTHDV